jgi:hypothetical protein
VCTPLFPDNLLSTSNNPHSPADSTIQRTTTSVVHAGHDYASIGRSFPFLHLHNISAFLRSSLAYPLRRHSSMMVTSPFYSLLAPSFTWVARQCAGHPSFLIFIRGCKDYDRFGHRIMAVALWRRFCDDTPITIASTIIIFFLDSVEFLLWTVIKRSTCTYNIRFELV